MKAILSAVGITKSFSGAPALRDGRLEVHQGEIHALMGANGAGKSTLLKILTGVYSKDAGQLSMVDDQGFMSEVEITSPRDADRLGIAIVHQELILSDNLSVADNVSLGAEPMKFGGLVLDKQASLNAARDALRLVGAEIDPSRPVSSLSTAEKQLVEIAKSLARNARLVILDEPTTSLTDNESGKLFEVLDKLRKSGITIVYVSHRMDEIFAICDRITVMRDGSYVDTLTANETSRDELIQLMIGRALAAEYERSPGQTAKIGARVLSVAGLSTPDLLRDVSVAVHRGEIVGMFGLIGAGRTEVARAMFGLDRPTAGTIHIQDQEFKRLTPERAISAGLGLVPEDRKDCGLVLDLSVSDNMELAALRNWKFVEWSGSRSRKLWDDFSKRMSIVARNRRQAVGTLSGGNQQKVVLAKWLAMKPSALILDEPTRGVDVGAKEEIYAIVRQLAADGAGVLLISSEIEEVLMISDRVVVMREGKVTFNSPNKNLDSHILLSAAMGEAA
jgi:ABC-type sugar transport system ATPase subunit